MSRLKATLLRIRDFMLNLLTSPWFSYKTNYTIDGTKWIMSRDDLDHWPSMPHFHSVEKDEKMNVYTGDIYDIKTKNYLRSVGKKDMKTLWKDKKAVAIIMYSIEKHDITDAKIPDYAAKMTAEEIGKALKIYDFSFKENDDAE